MRRFGWGQELAQFFDLSKINVVNRAIGGRSSRTFQYEGRWDMVLAEMKKGDFVIIQFGHNDVGKYDDPAAKDRPALHGEDEATAEVTRLDGKKETVHTFGWYMRKYGNDAKEKGALVNAASTSELSDFHLSAIVKRGNLKIAISTNGKSPALAKRLKEVFSDALPEQVDDLLDNMPNPSTRTSPAVKPN